MNIKQNWPSIKEHFKNTFRSSLHVSIASVDQQNQPTVTPIGSLFLNDNMTGFYFEKYPSKLPAHAQGNKNICVLGVNSNKRFWLKSLFRNRFSQYPAIKLYGTLGEKREATPTELRALKRRMRFTKRFKGHQYLWGEMNRIRDVHFHKAEVINLGEMTSHL